MDFRTAGKMRLGPQLVVGLLAWSGPLVVAALRDQNPIAIIASVSWAGADPVPVWLDQRRELSELRIHRQQLLQALGRPSDLRPDVAGPVFDGLRWAYPYRLASEPGVDGDFVTITVTGEVPRIWHLAVDCGKWVFTPVQDHRYAQRCR